VFIRPLQASAFLFFSFAESLPLHVQGLMSIRKPGFRSETGVSQGGNPLPPNKASALAGCKPRSSAWGCRPTKNRDINRMTDQELMAWAKRTAKPETGTS